MTSRSYAYSHGTAAVQLLSCCFKIAAASATLASGTILPGMAADGSSWQGDSRSAVRLIAAAAAAERGARILRAGIEFKLGAGWKMYWRHPGDAGVPPRFDFAGSKNVKEIAVLWPAPQRFSEEGSHLIVYKGDVVLPLRIVPEHSASPVIIRLKLDYGICEKFCIPAEARSELLVSGNPTSYESKLAAAEARAPKKVRIGEAGPFSITAVRHDPGSSRPRIVVDVAAPDAANVDLFAEGPTPEWALPVPQQISAQHGLRQFAFDLDGIPPGVGAAGALLKLTATTGDEAIEVSTPID